MIDEPTEEQAALYALGALSAEDARALEAQMPGNAQLRSLVARLREVSAALAGSTPALQPPVALRARLLRQIDTRNPEATRTARPRSGLPWTLAAALAVVCVALAWRANLLRGQTQVQLTRIDALNATVQMLSAESVDLRQTAQRLQQSNRLANMRVALLSSLLASAPKAVAVSVWDNAQQSGVLIVRDLRPAPPNKDYQLWIIDPKYAVPVDAGVFRVDAQGQVRIAFRAKQPIQAANQFAVTQENRGGSPTPTLKAMVLAGS